MSYTAVPTKSTGDLWTASDHNTYIRDNFAAGVPDIFTTKGDIAAASATDVAERLGIGTTGQLLTVDHTTTTGLKWATNAVLDLIEAKGDLLVGSAADTLDNLAVGADGHLLVADSGETLGLRWDTFPTARYYNNTGQDINDNSATIVNYGSQDWDTSSAVTTGAAWKFTIPTDGDGKYIVIASALFNSTSAWELNEPAYLQLFKNGSANAYLSYNRMQTAGTYNVFLQGSAAVDLVATDYIDVRIFQNSDTTLRINPNGSYNHISIVRLY